MSASASASANGAAITAAAKSVGEGGTVTIPSGTFSVSGASIPRGVTIQVDGDLAGPADVTMLSNATYETTGTITAGEVELTVADASHFHSGDVVQIDGAGELFDGTRMAHVAQVISVTAPVVLLDAAPVTSVNGETVIVGASNITITGTGTLAGSATNDTSRCIGVGRANNITISGLTITNANRGISMGAGVRNSTLSNLTFIDVGDVSNPSQPLGAAIFALGHVQSCRFEDIDVTGGSYAILLDDRSTTADEADGKCRSNTIRRVTTNGTIGGIIVHGSDDNLVSDCTITNGSGTGISIDGSNQGTSEFRSAERNTVSGCTLTNMGVGIWVARFGTTADTVLSGNSFSGCDDDVLNGE